MLPIIAAAASPIIGKLLENGLNILANAITSKGKEFVEDKIGVKLDDPVSSEDLLKLKQLEFDHQETLLKLGMETEQLRIEEVKLSDANTADARKMNAAIQTSEHASKFAKDAAYYIDFFIIGATVTLIGIILFQAVPTVNKELFYMALGSLITMCGTILNFHRGSSSRSAKKDETIMNLSQGGG